MPLPWHSPISVPSVQLWGQQRTKMPLKHIVLFYQFAETVSLLENYHPRETQLNINKLFQIIHRVLFNISDMRKLIA